MKVFLMHRDRDVDLESDLPRAAEAVTQDLELDTLLAAMAAGDEFLLTMARRAVLFSLADPEEIIYRQQVLADAIEQPDVVRGVFTHFKREEDATMEQGKLDEELGRMSGIAGQIGPGCLLLCNESFASTNEREGSQIARQIVRAFLESGVRVIYVTHLFDLAHSFHVQDAEAALFLRPERRQDGTRTFRLLPGQPLPTSYGPDLYQQIFTPEPETPAGGSPQDARKNGRLLVSGPAR